MKEIRRLVQNLDSKARKEDEWLTFRGGINLKHEEISTGN